MSDLVESAVKPDLIADFKEAMRCLSASVTIVTTQSEGNRSGMTATAVTSLSAKPPSLLVCVNQTASIHPALRHGSRFCVNILGDLHSDLAMAFGGGAEPESRFALGRWIEDSHGVPYLQASAAAVFCIVDRLFDYATHSIVVGRVYAAVANSSTAPLLYGAGRFSRPPLEKQYKLSPQR